MKVTLNLTPYEVYVMTSALNLAQSKGLQESREYLQALAGHTATEGKADPETADMFYDWIHEGKKEYAALQKAKEQLINYIERTEEER